MRSTLWMHVSLLTIRPSFALGIGVFIYIKKEEPRNQSPNYVSWHSDITVLIMTRPGVESTPGNTPPPPTPLPPNPPTLGRPSMPRPPLGLGDQPASMASSFDLEVMSPTAEPPPEASSSPSSGDQVDYNDGSVSARCCGMGGGRGRMCSTPEVQSCHATQFVARVLEEQLNRGNSSQVKTVHGLSTPYKKSHVYLTLEFARYYRGCSFSNFFCHSLLGKLFDEVSNSWVVRHDH